jgi:5-methylcytosine-specific restriction protein A
MALGDITAEAVNSALDEYDAIGREAFLARYGFGPAKSYFLAHDGKSYDSKAIVGCAHGYARPDLGPLRHQDFSGGEATVASLLRDLGFEVEHTVLEPPGEKPSQRNPPWTRDELILALDFYFAHRRTMPDKRSEDIAALSQEINATAQRLGLSGSETLRNPNGVYMKLMNLRSHDPEFTERGRKGLSRGNKDEKVVWDQFVGDLHRLREAAEAIRARLAEESGGEERVEEFDEPEIAEAAEGRLVTRLHRTRERNRKLVRSKKAKFQKDNGGRLFCEACGFDFEREYGERGTGFIECHHTWPVHTLRAGQKTKLTELALLCANCHRMIHSKTPWLDLEELRRIIVAG